ncbi:MAG: phosphoenolpyruvate carboxylase [Parvularcula sp.]|nr:phosphoenolpyruvate carboxylase [Parvularcula sp.]
MSFDLAFVFVMTRLMRRLAISPLEGEGGGMLQEPISAPSLRERLSELRGNLMHDPLANPVRRLAHELSVAIEKGALSLDETDRLIEELSCEAAGARRERLSAYLAEAGTLEDAFETWLGSAAEAAELGRVFANPIETIVLTGHPTFAMTRAGRAAMGGEGDLTDATAIREGITLNEEHGEAREALRVAGEAAFAASQAAIRVLDRQGIDPAQHLPMPVGLATWVGYDLDGRQDIGWPQIIVHRLIEKNEALNDLIARLSALASKAKLDDVLARLRAAQQRTEEVIALFSDAEALTSEEGIAAAANRLTEEDEGHLVSLEPLIAEVVAAAREAKGDDRVRLLAIASLMKHRGLGLGEIHFRLNAAQIRNAARSLLPVTRDVDLFGHTALSEINEAVASVEPIRVNFRSLAHETSSARRISIAAAQILKHIDANTPIRFLIAECENPVTVLTAIYLARRYGMQGKLDICPLFETAKSFDRSRRILAVLLAQPSFQEQVRARGRIAIETGFSDAGRFMGQLSATLAIERLQAQLAEEMSEQGLTDLDAIVFNTHGESMGRGGHPKSILDRSAYVMSPWARSKFVREGIVLRHEISFQGGDGYLWFSGEEKANAVMAGLLRARSFGQTDPADPFYERREASLDFFNTVRAEQIQLFDDEAMAMVAMGPGLSLLPPAGSRKTKRQFERRSEEDLSLRSIRAISHNGSLQQIGYVANLHAGVGEAIAVEPEAYEELYETSDRFRRLMDLVASAARLSDMKTLIAYLKLYDGSFWATRPISGREPHIERACADLATHLIGDRRYFAALQIAARLRPGAIGLKRSLARMGFEDLGPGPLNLDLLHAVRIALIQHMFILGAKLPQFARAAGFSREEVLEEILALSVPDAVAQLREGFPKDGGKGDPSLFEEPADEESEGRGYHDIEEETIYPLERSFEQCRRISLAVAHHFGAHG